LKEVVKGKCPKFDTYEAMEAFKAEREKHLAQSR